MLSSRNAVPVYLAATFVVLVAASSARGHFLWLNTVDDGTRSTAFLYFSESAAEQDYRVPERIAKADLWQRLDDGEKHILQSTIVETEGRSGMEAPLQPAKNAVLEARCRYGIYHGSLLTYHAKYIGDVAADDQSPFRSPDFDLDVVPTMAGNTLQLTVLWKGKPLAGAEVLVDQTAGEATEHVTDEAGRVEVTPTAAGLVGIRTGHTEKDAAGELDGESYQGAAYHTTLTFHWNPTEANAAVSASYPDLPEAIASFGAAVHDGWLYVYGGHTGESHAHSRENISPRFVRLNLRDGRAWEELPMQTHLQSPALVAHGKYLYRVGGMTALNAPDEEDDLRSVAEFAHFDPQEKKWTALPDLPQPRSSHDAVVIGDKLYVVGGWVLDGEGHGRWCPSALVFDLSPEAGQWRELPEPDFRRRALATAEWQGKLVAIGGMTDESEVSERVDFFDPDTQEWSQGPDLPPSNMHGFGVAACNVDGSLYVSGASGVVYRLSADGEGWEKATELEIPRFFHRLVPAPDGGLLAVAGAARGRGHIAGVERIRLGDRAAGGEPGRLSSRDLEGQR